MATSNLVIVESIPEGLTYPSSSPMHMTTYDAWIQLLSQATASVDITSFYCTLRGRDDVKDDKTDKQGLAVYNELARLKKREVSLRIAQNCSNERFPNHDSRELARNGLATVQEINFANLQARSQGILHTKLWVVDQKHFYVGSANLDWRALTQVKELGLLGMDCECLAQDAQKLFDIYWYLSSPRAAIPRPWPSSYNAMFNMNHPASISIKGSPPVPMYWTSSPPSLCAGQRTTDLEAVLSIINKAEKFLNIAIMDYLPEIIYTEPKCSWTDIDDALRAAARNRGVHVRIMGSDWTRTRARQKIIDSLKSLAASSKTGPHRGIIEAALFEVPPLSDRTIPFTRVNHNKYMVSEKAAFITTSNWSGDYFLFTGGVSCVLNQTDTVHHGNASLHSDLVSVFERDWNSKYTRKL